MGKNFAIPFSTNIEKKVEDMLREEFASIEDQTFMTELNKIDFSEQLAVGYPVTKNKSDKKLLSQSELFYYIHLAPFARKSITET